MKYLRVMFIFALLAMLIVPLSITSAQDDNILRIVSNFDIRTSDPHSAYELETWPTAALFYIGLVRWSEDNTEVVPALAESFTISDDGLTYTFVLREGIKFSNGRDITPDDVKYSFERLLNPATAAPTAFMFQDIAGTAEFQSGDASELSGVQVVDDRTVTFTLSLPVYSMIQRFALPPAFIVAKEGVEAAGDNFGFQPLGAGPFVLDNWEQGLVISGSRNPNYYLSDRPYFDGFEMQLLIEPSVGILRMEGNEADIALDWVPATDYPRIAADPALAAQLLPAAGFPNIDYVVLNDTIEPFSNVDVRRAMAMSVDRQRLVQILNGRAVPAAGPIGPTVLGDNKDLMPLEYDPEGAKALLAEAGYPDGFSANFLVNTDPTNVSVVQALINDWAAVGINLEMTSIDNAQFLDILINQPDTLEVVMTNWYQDYPDPSNIYEPLISCAAIGTSYNWGQFCDTDLDAAFAAANAIPPGDERWAAFSDFEAMIVDKMPVIYLDHLVNYYYTSTRLDMKADPGILLRWDTATVK